MNQLTLSPCINQFPMNLNLNFILKRYSASSTDLFNGKTCLIIDIKIGQIGMLACWIVVSVRFYFFPPNLGFSFPFWFRIWVEGNAQKLVCDKSSLFLVAKKPSFIMRLYFVWTLGSSGFGLSKTQIWVAFIVIYNLIFVSEMINILQETTKSAWKLGSNTETKINTRTH